MTNAWSVPKLWYNATCFIIGGGASMPRQFNVPEEIVQGVTTWKLRPNAYSEYLKPIHDKHVIGINNAYQIGTWIDMVFFGDSSWYLVHRQALAQWPGLKISCAPRFGHRNGPDLDGVKYVPRDKGHKHGISKSSSTVSWNGNSGAAAISVAAHLGVKKIALLGFDMTLDENQISHWHGSHRKAPPSAPKRRKFNPPFLRHLVGFDAIAKDAEAIGIEIVNISQISKITQFKKVTLDEVLANS